MEKTRVIIADDHTILRQGLRSLLSDQEDMELVGEATDGREAIEMARELRPDVVVMDISMQKLNGVEATRQILEENDQIKVIVLSIHVEISADQLGPLAHPDQAEMAVFGRLGPHGLEVKADTIVLYDQSGLACLALDLHQGM